MNHLFVKLVGSVAPQTPISFSKDGGVLEVSEYGAKADDGTVKREPFSIIAEGLSLNKSRNDKTSIDFF